MIHVVPKCPRQCGGYIIFVLRVIEPPFEGMDKLGVNDVQCDTCHHIFERNIFGLEYHLTVRQTKILIRAMAEERGGELTITDLLDRWPIDPDVVVRAFEELNDEADVVWQAFVPLNEKGEP